MLWKYVINNSCFLEIPKIGVKDLFSIKHLGKFRKYFISGLRSVVEPRFDEVIRKKHIWWCFSLHCFVTLAFLNQKLIYSIGEVFPIPHLKTRSNKAIQNRVNKYYEHFLRILKHRRCIIIIYWLNQCSSAWYFSRTTSFEKKLKFCPPCPHIYNYAILSASTRVPRISIMGLWRAPPLKSDKLSDRLQQWDQYTYTTAFSAEAHNIQYNTSLMSIIKLTAKQTDASQTHQLLWKLSHLLWLYHRTMICILERKWLYHCICGRPKGSKPSPTSILKNVGQK